MNSTNPWAADKEHLQEILQRDEFQALHTEGESWLVRVSDFLLEWLARLFSWSDIPSGAATTASTVVLVVAALLLVMVIFWLFRRMVWEQKRKASLFVNGEKIRSYADYLREAQECADRGEWREGERSLFLALLVYMQKQSWIRIEQWKTNWEYADEIEANHPEAKALFRRYARAFEQAWYGQVAVDKADYLERIRELAQILDGEGQHE
ncbi:DUF4129 domain-containing protein [Brevibacillus agri]|uniref:DUF4129 domain-containing protein n=1 Tax=Brevibacillus agri TaxID=51101 RepID=UPI0024C03338|nr:DUF4129 domain-containing protein [Brevibacillus agri]WHX28789.1 DUF4129 domain-containing protein [Brevibacillus agri]